MDKEDARFQTLGQLHERRKQVVRLHRKGIRVMRIVELSGLSYPTVRGVVDRYEQDGAETIKPTPRGGRFNNRPLTFPQCQVAIQQPTPFAWAFNKSPSVTQPASAGFLLPFVQPSSAACSASSYINAQSKIQDTLKVALKDGKLVVPAEFEAQRGQVAEVLQKLSSRLEIKNADERKQIRTRQAVLHTARRHRLLPGELNNWPDHKAPLSAFAKDKMQHGVRLCAKSRPSVRYR
jgi:hypothetical protein